jgi:hypothetical protein
MKDAIPIKGHVSPIVLEVIRLPCSVMLLLVGPWRVLVLRIPDFNPRVGYGILIPYFSFLF